jgi:hypothetical protein
MVDQVIDAMDYAVYVHDVSHIVLDNLQFMLSGACVPRPTISRAHWVDYYYCYRRRPSLSLFGFGPPPSLSLLAWPLSVSFL